MLTALKGNIIESLSPDILGIHPSSYLVLEDGRIAGIYAQLPETMAEAAVFAGEVSAQTVLYSFFHSPVQKTFSLAAMASISVGVAQTR